MSLPARALVARHDAEVAPDLAAIDLDVVKAQVARRNVARRAGRRQTQLLDRRVVAVIAGGPGSVEHIAAQVAQPAVGARLRAETLHLADRGAARTLVAVAQVVSGRRLGRPKLEAEASAVDVRRARGARRRAGAVGERLGAQVACAVIAVGKVRACGIAQAAVGASLGVDNVRDGLQRVARDIDLGVAGVRTQRRRHKGVGLGAIGDSDGEGAVHEGVGANRQNPAWAGQHLVIEGGGVGGPCQEGE
eukprot:352084-Chlamydomonas_euryale.AAC.3